MKVKTHIISEQDTEEVQLFVHQLTPDFENLQEYIEMEKFRSQILLCNREKEVCRISFSIIFYIESIQEIQYIHTSNGIYTTRQRLYILEKMLPENFVRASKSTLLNMDTVKSYKPLTGGLMFATFPNEEGTYISRRYVKELKNKFRKE
ncbi:MAG: LytTR family DNA-binding domain-containing protein [Oliverpabstia sp.]|nr:LytTR family DNA-binding domain-containing protein [Oliverpabstia sp.]